MNETNKEMRIDSETLLRYGSAIGVPRSPLRGVDGDIDIGLEGAPYLVTPNDYQVHDLEWLLNSPVRKRGQFKFNDAKSFIAYFKKHQMASTIYAQLNPAKFIAVLDDHRNDEPGWRDHIATYECPLSVEWKTWSGKNKTAMKQPDFAQFIEDTLPDIVDPSAADMLEISRTLEAKKKVDFASGVRLSNGQVEITYNEEISGTASKGKLQIPETFSIGIPVLEGGERYKVEARLRYRIDEGKLVMWYDLLRPHKVHEDAIMGVWKHIADETKTEILNGVPALS